MNEQDLKYIIEATLLAAGKPVSTQQLLELFDERERPTAETLQTALGMLMADYENRGIELVEVASGWRIQVRPRFAEVVSRLWQERPAKYSRALLETLALIAYRQPITRSEIEEIRGVSISSTIMRTLQERGWIRTVGHREVPGRPELLGTTREFLDYFGLKSLDQLPTLAELKDVETIGVQLELTPDQGQEGTNAQGGESSGDAPAGTEGEAAASAESQTEASAAESGGGESVDAASGDVRAESDDAESAESQSDEVAEAQPDEIQDEAREEAPPTDVQAAETDSGEAPSAATQSESEEEIVAEADAHTGNDEPAEEDTDDGEGNIDDGSDESELSAEPDDDEDSDAPPIMVASAEDEQDHVRIGEPPAEH
jgi:segregation and condensation protein B